MGDLPLQYSKKEACRLAGVSMPTLDGLIKSGTLPVVRPSRRRVLIPGEAFRRYLSGESKAE